ncbi:acetylornithine aminotransferase [Clostridium homopropionicum DSM 5847]|uniref:Acetylornithine aminotransferase n=1 Tax=Clostridium homopropionicum DSM 5847 TaxID=1121318 RepID=A0A0L6Z7G5_9CLOT|nr:aspartate aminotransferase family protein [Clostridium homopropionicum]KOA18912.1 acetylornithine aminotransferase [Clostridium homopropionicum DSM 5847]SFG44733.1 acetylornithine/N-succinyldiaminopimelate aminotransferase [Clostridium homopropionicum]
MSRDYIMNTYGRFDVSFEKGLGTSIYDENGKEYLDFVSGIATNCLGHSHPVIVKAIQEQSSKLMHISNYYWNSNALKLAEKLCTNSDHEKAFFCNSGTEAIEAALKLSRKYGRMNGSSSKSKIIYMNNSFHGRTMGALSVTGQGKYQENFAPLIGNVESIDFNDIDVLKNAFDEDVCGVILEPIQGEGGIIPANIDFLKEARSLCDKYNALLIFDEVQCGIGRTGSLFAYQKLGVIPDVICMAKALGGGFPIGGIITNSKCSSAFVPGDHGTTYGGNPLACAVSFAVLTELIDGGVISSVDEKSNYIYEKLNELKKKYSVIDDIRGIGLLIGVAVNTDPKNIVNECFKEGLLVVSAGKNVIRLLPPLNVTLKEIDSALCIFEKVLSKFC